VIYIGIIFGFGFPPQFSASLSFLPLSLSLNSTSLSFLIKKILSKSSESEIKREIERKEKDVENRE
jgi:hypothetical protein